MVVAPGFLARGGDRSPLGRGGSTDGGAAGGRPRRAVQLVKDVPGYCGPAPTRRGAPRGRFRAALAWPTPLRPVQRQALEAEPAVPPSSAIIPHAPS
jgi:hypothetical protein